MNNIDLLTILPVLILTGYACVLLLVDLFIPSDKKARTGWLALVGLVAAGVGLLPWPSSGFLYGFNNMVVADGLAVFLNFLFILAGVITILLALNYLPRTGIDRGEFYVLLLFTLAGMMLMAQATDLIVVFLALELLSIPLYILSGIARPRVASEESAMKYFLLGAFASGFLVYGIALTYGATGATNLTEILTTVEAGYITKTVGETIQTFGVSLPILGLGVGLIFVGLGFKVAAAPFHMWTPDVYDGAPSIVTSFMAVGAKVGGFAALLRVLLMAFPQFALQWMTIAAFVAGLTMIVGNFAAIMQSNVKRLLAYSSIAHAGYILMGVVAMGMSNVRDYALGGALFYLLSYTVTSLGTWAIVMAVERSEGRGLNISDYAGLGKRRPGLALAMTIFMFSLTGLPPTVGFIAKVYVFTATLQAGFFLLAVVGVLTSLVSAYYYLNVIRVMYMQEGTGATVNTRVANLTVGLTAIATLVLGLMPEPMMNLAMRSLMSLAK